MAQQATRKSELWKCIQSKQHLRIDASLELAVPEAGCNDTANGSGLVAAGARQAAASLKQREVKGPNPKGQLAVDEFVAQVLPLLDLEREAEVAAAEGTLASCSPEAAQARGVALLNLRLADAEGGLLGRTLLTLVNNKGGGTKPLPPHKLSPHDIVRLRPSKADSSGSPLTEGVVYRVKEQSLVVAVEEMPDEGLDVPLRLEKLANTVTHQRLKAALGALRGEGGLHGVAAPLVDVMFGRRAPKFGASVPAWVPVNAGLDESQQRAVTLALASQDVALIHGPPGTGKTTAVVEVCVQEVLRGSRVLACAASNVAVDNLVERLAQQAVKGSGGRGINVVRVGHPARLLPQVLENSLEARVLQSDNSALARDCRKEMKALNSWLLKLGGRKDRDERREVRAELRRLGKEERQRQEKAVAEVLQGAQVICTTLTGVGVKLLDKLQFDVVIVDEAAQALEAACWAALLKGRRCVLAGDHLQLPPTVVSEEAARRGLARTLFERLQELWGDGVSEMLTVQYRMHHSIMDWSSQEMYGGRLQAHGSVAEHTLADLQGVREEAASLPVLLLVDTAGCEMWEQQEEEGDSKRNDGEAAVVMAHVRRLVAAGVRTQDIGIITPYNAQVGRLRELRPEGGAQALLEISTVDGFQGREKDAIIISMVRSNETGQVGFLADSRRMNVAVTRARRHCALVCDTETVSKDPFLKRLVDYFEQHGEYESAEGYG
ncbi:hypothetical protein N2152v2_001283 [Parachlorella kessleri]